jgi:hypothetical protein
VSKLPQHILRFDEIAKLPRWARVALAARCAWRALELFPGNAIAAGSFTALHRAVRLAEHAAAGIAPVIANDVLLAAHEVCQALAGERAVAAARAAFSAALAAAGALDAAAATDPGEREDYDRGSATQAFLACRHGATAVAGDASAWTGFTLQFQLDYDWLLRVASAQGWTDATPVPPQTLGPLLPACDSPTATALTKPSPN